MKSKKSNGSKANTKAAAKKSTVLLDSDAYRPVPFYPQKHIAEMRAKSPEFCAAYDALEQEFAALDIQLAGRYPNNLTPLCVSERFLHSHNEFTPWPSNSTKCSSQGSDVESVEDDFKQR